MIRTMIGLCFVAGALIGTPSFSTGSMPVRETAIQASRMPLPLKVVKTQVLNSHDERVILRGVNAASLEWTSNGEGHILDTVKTAIDDWHVNHIRLPMAQDRWFGKAPEQKDDGKSRIYMLPITGGTPKAVTTAVPSYWHGWSPDGKTMVYCGERDGEFDIYTIPADGGPETRLTTAKGLDDGPEFSADGTAIYFNSNRNGTMQIWRMKPDGSDQEPITVDEFNNWFPHPPSDGRSLVFLSYEKDVTGHPENKDVSLRMMNLRNKTTSVLGRFFGGQGTINVPCWSPDGRKIAFVSYQWIP